MSRARALWRTPSLWVDGLIWRVAKSDLARERSLVVVGPEAAQGLWRRDMARSATYLAVVVGVVWLPDGNLWRTLAMAALGGMVGGQLNKLTQRADAYRSGWLDGRKRFVEQGKHHERQGNTTRDWLTTERDHDAYHVLGARHALVDYDDEDGTP